MREILFRGKRADNGKWITSQTRLHNEKTGFDYLFDREDSANSEIVIEDVNEQNFIYGMERSEQPIFYRVENICEYTGLVDKNGAKIFDGDIMDVFSSSDLFYYGRGIVKWDDTKCAFRLFIIEDEELVYTINEYCVYEVVGNIFDNPDFLKFFKNKKDIGR